MERKERARREDEVAKPRGGRKWNGEGGEQDERGAKRRRDVRKRGEGMRRGGRTESRRVEWRRGEMMPWRARGGDLGGLDVGLV